MEQGAGLMDLMGAAQLLRGKARVMIRCLALQKFYQPFIANTNVAFTCVSTELSLVLVISL